MAIPLGTTGRQVSTLARWVLASVVVVGMLSWWWPDYQSWGAMAGSLLVVWTLWLVWKTQTGDRKVSGHLAYYALLVPAALLTFHLMWSGLGKVNRPYFALSGGMNISMIYQLALAALGIMLTQDLMPQAARHMVVLSLCGAAMVSGMIAAEASGQAGQVRGPLALLGLAGVCVWLSPMWGQTGDTSTRAHLSRRRELRVLYACPATVAAGVLVWLAPVQGAVAVGTVALVAGLVAIAARGKPALIAAMLVLAGGAGAALVLHEQIPGLEALAPGQGAANGLQGWETLIGRGEEAFVDVSAGDSGLTVLLACVGTGGAAGFVLGLIGCLTWSLRDIRAAGRDDKVRVVIWSSATVLTTLAFLWPAGWVLPGVTLAMGFTWGLLPTMLGRTPNRHRGEVLMVLVVGLVLLLGVSRRDGLVGWSMRSFGGSDQTLHVVVGFLLSMVLAWLMGSRRMWLGLAGIALSILAGGAGELVQGLASRRTMDVGDALWHAVGSAGAILPYLLAMGSRWCESPDVTSRRLDAHQAYGVW
jgi:hypothetical protein